MSAASLRLETPIMPAGAEALRRDVREFVDEERAAGRLLRPSRIGLGFDREMSRRIGTRGWIGLTWPKRYGGHERSALERYVVTEELLAAAVPVGAHWFSDRQSGPVLLRFGNEAQRERFLPRIVRGECAFGIGMSEPDSGSDLASLRTRADRSDGGWRINGRKIWTTNAHLNDYIVVLVRTSSGHENRHMGFSQFIVDLKAPGVTVSPIVSMPGDHDFNETTFDNVFVENDALIGQEGNGWNQVSAELAYERSGPERWLSSFRLLAETIDVLGCEASPATQEELGRLLSHLLSLRQLSLSVASMLQQGLTPNVEAAIVKDLGTKFEQELVRVCRGIVLAENLTAQGRAERLRGLLAHSQMWAPAFTLRGGTTEILRGIIAKGLGLR